MLHVRDMDKFNYIRSSSILSRQPNILINVVAWAENANKLLPHEPSMLIVAECAKHANKLLTHELSMLIIIVVA